MSDDRCFAFVDLAGYTALTEAHGDEDAADIAARFYELARNAIEADTRIVKQIGDAVMLVSTDASACARSVLRMFERASAETDFLGLRAGLFSGPAVERGNDFFGATVNLAARIAAYARSGEVLCGAAMAAELERTAALLVRLGTVRLKNVSDEVELFSLLVADAAESASTVLDPVCRMRVSHGSRSVEHDGARYCFCSEGCADRFRRSPERYVEPTR